MPRSLANSVARLTKLILDYLILSYKNDANTDPVMPSKTAYALETAKAVIGLVFTKSKNL